MSVMDESISQHDLLRKKSLAVPTVNPFIHEGIKLTFGQKIQIFLMSLTIAPIRFILVLLTLFMAWVIAFIFTLGMDMEKPVSQWRRSIFEVIAWMGRFMFIVMGFLKVDVKGKRAPSSDAVLLVGAPHSSFFDALLWFCTAPLPSAVSRTENTHTPGFGSLMKILQPVLVTRDYAESRQQAIDEIQRRAKSSENWSQVIIFPEGTCTNRKALITFKGGAFIPGVPIQPVMIRYPNLLDTYTWTMNGPGGLTLMWLTLCQFKTNFEVEFLPVYRPNEEEIEDPKLFAENVRHLMAKALGVPCTDHTFEDCRLMNQAKSRNLPMEAGLVEFSKLNKKLGIGIDEMKTLLDEFAHVSGSCEDGMMGIEEFAEHLKLPVTKPLESLFHMYDRDGSGKIDFREYVIGLSLVSHAAVTEKTVKLAFKVFDRDGDGLVSRNELDHVLKSVFGSEFDTQKIYEVMDTDGKGKIDYDQFYAFAKKRPEYAKLFVSYTELEEDEMPDIKSHTSLRQLGSSRVHFQDDKPSSSNDMANTSTLHEHDE